MTHNASACPKRSSLARLQQGLVISWVVAALVWVAWSAPRSGWLCLGGLLLLAGGHAIVLAVQLLCRVAVAGDDTSSKPRMGELVRAWRTESWLAVRVFAWQQPFRWRKFPDSLQSPAGWRAVVLVHGFVCNRGFWLPWLGELRRRQRPYVTVNLEPVFGSIDDYVPVIDAAVQRARKLTGRDPLLVGHSMGGLAIRAWLVSAHDAPLRVHRVITIGSPHAGTWLANWSRVPNGRQMRPLGAWLDQLAQKERAMRGDAPYTAFTCWYANTDNIVFPVLSATLPGADNRQVRGAPHVGLAYESQVLADVIQGLDEPAH
ncbi:MAG: esterase/lipase family protein [Gammaproteobacteria bacterium]